MQNKVSLFLGLVLSGVILTMLTWGFYGDGLQSWTAVVENNYQNPGERSKIAGTDYGASGHEIEGTRFMALWRSRSKTPLAMGTRHLGFKSRRQGIKTLQSGNTAVWKHE